MGFFLDIIADARPTPGFPAERETESVPAGKFPCKDGPLAAGPAEPAVSGAEPLPVESTEALPLLTLSATTAGTARPDPAAIPFPGAPLEAPARISVSLPALASAAAPGPAAPPLAMNTSPDRAALPTSLDIPARLATEPPSPSEKPVESPDAALPALPAPPESPSSESQQERKPPAPRPADGGSAPMVSGTGTDQEPPLEPSLAVTASAAEKRPVAATLESVAATDVSHRNPSPESTAVVRSDANLPLEQHTVVEIPEPGLAAVPLPVPEAGLELAPEAAGNRPAKIQLHEPPRPSGTGATAPTAQEPEIRRAASAPLLQNALPAATAPAPAGSAPHREVVTGPPSRESAPPLAEPFQIADRAAAATPAPGSFSLPGPDPVATVQEGRTPPDSPAAAGEISRAQQPTTAGAAGDSPLPAAIATAADPGPAPAISKPERTTARETPREVQISIGSIDIVIEAGPAAFSKTRCPAEGAAVSDLASRCYLRRL